nr:cardiolipin synthase [uncultured Desulfuromonas sp.]
MNGFSVGIVIINLLSLAVAIHALLNKRDPRAALAWIIVCLALPGVGVVLYWLMGVNRIRTRALRWQRRGEGIYVTEKEPPCESSVELRTPFHTQNYQLQRHLADAVTRRPLLGGNRVVPLYNGEQAYPAMLKTIRAANHSINLSSYIFDTQFCGREFVQALIERANAGVAVRVLVDGLGECYSWPRVHTLFEQSPVQVARFLPLSLFRRGMHLNLRNHRKLLIVDGQTGFAGGMNISQRHLVQKKRNDVRPRQRVADLHFKVEGPVVRQMLEVFQEDWQFAGGSSFNLEPAPPCLAGPDSLCRGISAGPNEDYEKLVWIVVGALNCARKRVSIMTPYFIPDRSMVTAMNSAALRGVNVEIVLPVKNNLPYVHWASRGAFWELLEYGVKIYYQPPPFAHSKLLLMDDHYALIGSANMDPRSQRLNFEFNLEVYDKSFNAEMRHHFDTTVAKSRAISLQEMDGRPVWLKMRDNFFRLFTPFL